MLLYFPVGRKTTKYSNLQLTGESVINFGFQPSGNSTPNVLQPVVQGGPGDDSWSRYLKYLAAKHKKKFKLKSAKIGLRPSEASSIARKTADEVVSREAELKTPYLNTIEINERAARSAAEAAINAIYNEMWQELAINTKELYNIERPLTTREQEEEAEFLMMVA